MLRSGMFLADRYEILEKIGSGGMSDVYKAKCHKLNRFVAIKVLKPEFSEDKSFVSKFKVEAQSAAGLAHPNIVSVFDVGEENDINYIVMELIEGITLKKYIERKGRLSAKETLSIAVQVAQGIEAAHNNHIIHRDIKPQNIIISREGKVKVTDFGIARAASANTINSNAMGSVHYISPEQARGGYIDEKSDIYSLGITMYEMITGHVPFEGDTTVAIALQHIQEPLPPFPEEYNIPVSVQKIIIKCTQKKADARYLKVSSLIADLKHALIAPDEDFVVMNAAANSSRTVIINKEELAQIKSASQNPNVAEEDFDLMDEDEDELSGEDDDDPADEEAEDDEEKEYEDGEDDIDAVNPKMDKVINIVSIIIAVIIVIALIFGGVKACKILKGGGEENPTEETSTGIGEDERYVPNLLGMTQEEAIEELEAKNLGYKIAGYEYSSEYEKGQVCGQSVEADEVVKTGTTIELTVSQGSENVAVIDFTGYTRTQIEEWCDEHNITPEFTYEINDEIEMDVVIRWSPEAPAEVKSGDTVSFVLSQGQEELEEIEVQNLVGKTLTEAKVLGQSEGFSVSVSSETYSETVDAGKIISQNPSSGTIPKGSTISVVVSLGAPEETVPDVTGKLQEEATAELENEGFTVSVDSQYSSTVQKGYVISQDPAGGTAAKDGSTVTIVVSAGVAMSVVPDVTGKTKGTAEEMLSDEGLTANFIEESSDTVTAGYVTRQGTSAGTSVEAGTKVDVYISTGPATYTAVIPGITYSSLNLNGVDTTDATITVKITAVADDGSTVTKTLAEAAPFSENWSFASTSVTFQVAVRTGTVTVIVNDKVVYSNDVAFTAS